MYTGPTYVSTPMFTKFHTRFSNIEKNMITKFTSNLAFLYLTIIFCTLLCIQLQHKVFRCSVNRFKEKESFGRLLSISDQPNLKSACKYLAKQCWSNPQHNFLITLVFYYVTMLTLHSHMRTILTHHHDHFLLSP